MIVMMSSSSSLLCFQSPPQPSSPYGTNIRRLIICRRRCLWIFVLLVWDPFSQQEGGVLAFQTTPAVSAARLRQQRKQHCCRTRMFLLLDSDNDNKIQQQQQQEETMTTSTTIDTINTNIGGDGASVPNLVINLIKSIVGSGVLALPASFAALAIMENNSDETYSLNSFTNEISNVAMTTTTTATSTTIAIIGCIIILLVGLMNAFFFSLVGRVCYWTGATGYRQAWDRTVGATNNNGVAGIRGQDNNNNNNNNNESSSQLVSIMVTLKTALSCIAFSMILADSFQSLAVAGGYIDVTRTQALLAVTISALLPLCLAQDLKALAPFSLLGLLGLGGTATSMILRWYDGSYSTTMMTTLMMEDTTVAHLLPSVVSTTSDVMDMTGGGGGGGGVPQLQGIATLVCTLATAFVAHYNAPRFYSELANKNQFDTVVGIAYGVSAIFFMIIATTGFLTFGTNSEPMILNSYSPYDPLMTGCRAAVAMSLVVTFPLPFVGLRDGILDLLQLEEQDEDDDRGKEEEEDEEEDRIGTTMTAPTSTNYLKTVASISILTVVTVAAASIQDLALVLSVGGGTFSTIVASVIPALMFRAAVTQQLLQEDDQVVAANSIERRQDLQRESNLAMGLMVVSVTIGAIGVYLALQKAFFVS